MRLDHHYNSIDIMMVAMALQVIAILIPTFSSNILFNLITGVLYGETFIGLVALFMNFGGQFSGKNLVFIMDKITATYGVGQVVSSLYCVALIKHFKNYNAALYLTALIICCGILLFKYAKADLMVNNNVANNL